MAPNPRSQILVGGHQLDAVSPSESADQERRFRGGRTGQSVAPGSRLGKIIPRKVEPEPTQQEIEELAGGEPDVDPEEEQADAGLEIE